MKNDWVNMLTKLRWKHNNLQILNKFLKILKHIVGESNNEYIRK